GGVFLVAPALQHTRLEHSTEVMLLLRRLGASELEQVAGLLHDVSHTAFSHVVDYVLGNAAEDYHEQILEQVVATSGLVPVLHCYGYHVTDVLSATFPLLEQPLPRLCADRLDYTLRDLLYAGMLTPSKIQYFLATLTVTGGRIAVTSVAAARCIQH
ncbi:MAG: HD domain-containing protein, partial [Hymenobacter sp.]